MNGEVNHERRVARALHEVFFSLNVGFAATHALLLFMWIPMLPMPFAYSYMYSAANLVNSWATRTHEFLHLSRRNPLGMQIALSALLLSIALAVYLVLRLLERTPLNRFVLSTIGGLAALALVPLVHLLFTGGELRLTEPYWQSPDFWCAVVELTLVCAFFLLARRRSYQPYLGGLAAIAILPWLFLHVVHSWQYGLWGSPEFWFSAVEATLICGFILKAGESRYQPYVGTMVLVLHYTLWTGQLFWTLCPALYLMLIYVLFPCSGFAWLYYSNTLQIPEPVPHEGK